MEFQIKRFFFGFGFYFHPHLKIGIKRRMNVFNKRKNEYQHPKIVFVIEFLFLSLGFGVFFE